jgi:DNA-binding XRE family transcriptional regulator
MENPVTEIRKSLKLTPQQFASFLKVSSPTVYAVERGFVENPRSIFKAMVQGHLVEDEEEFKQRYKTWWDEKEARTRDELKKRIFTENSEKTGIKRM